MNKVLLTASAALALALPATAFAQGQGHAGGGVNAHANTHASGSVGTMHAETDARANVRATTRTGTSIDRTRTTSTRTGDRDDRMRTTNTRTTSRVATNTRASTGNKWNGYACAPGLADRGCVPPGQMKRGFETGERLPDNYRYYSQRTAIPTDVFGRLPDQYETGNYRYIYRPDQSIYVVDPATSLIRYVLNL